MTKRKGAKKQERAPLPPVKVDKAYLAALESYWNGDSEYCKAILVNYLYEQQVTDTAICMYRLWIEVLASDQDESGLRLLQRHLSDFTESAPKLAAIFYAFIGLIHLELDELEAAQLFLRGLGAEAATVYGLELQLRLQARVATALPKSQLLSDQSLWFDYVQIEKIGSLFWQFNKKSKLNQLCSYVDSLFPASPLSTKIRIAQLLERKDWKSAFKAAQSLYQKFPNHRQSVIFYSSSLALAKQFDESIFSLERLHHTHHDSEFLTLLSYSYCLKFKDSGEADDLDRAKRLIEKAAKVEQRQGAISSLCSTIKARIEAMTNQSRERQPLVWMVQINAKNFHQLRTEFHEGKLVRKPLGAKLLKGDVCIFVYEDQHRSEYEDAVTWRFGAIASVVDDPEWHPYHRFQSQLRIELIPSVAVPLDIKSDQGRPVDPMSFDIEDPRRYRAFELDSQALSIVDESLRQFSDEYELYSDTMSNLRLAQ